MILSNLANPPFPVPIHLVLLPSIAIEEIPSSGKSELFVSATIKFVPLNLTSPPPVPIHLLPLPSMALDEIVLDGKAELDVL